MWYDKPIPDIRRKNSPKHRWAHQGIRSCLKLRDAHKCKGSFRVLMSTFVQAGWPRISPDSRFIACEYTTDGKTSLAVLSIEGEPLKLFDVPKSANFRFGIRWTPDGNAVAYRDWFKGIWMQPIDGGEPVRLEGLPEEKLFGYGWSRDGRQFAFVRGAEVRDLVLFRR